MSRLARFVPHLLLAALAVGFAAPVLARAQATAPKQTSTAEQPRKAAAKPRGKAAKSAQARNQAGKALLGKKQNNGPGGLSRDDLTRPYSAGSAFGPPAPAKPEADNATSLNVDLEPRKRPFAKKAQPDSPVSFHFGRDQVVDPITGLEVDPKPGAASAKENVKNMDLKGALQKTGGKAEVQVDILKF